MPRVLYISSDGMRPDAISAARADNLLSLMSRGAYTLGACSVMPSVSLPCHMSIFHSVPPQRHGIVQNTFTPMARPVPGLIDVLQEAGRKCCSFYSWEPLRDVSRPGRLAVSSLIAYRRNPEEADDLVVRAALPHLSSGDFDFAFLYLATMDEVGHDHGWMSERYLEQVAHADRLIGEVVESLPSDTVVLVHSDHGGHGRTHGTDAAEDMNIPWIIAGPGIRRDHRIESSVSLLDTAPTIAAILGVEPAESWEGRAVDEIFLP
ncbi:MAG TPA: alkaline phosphatase family protein [Trueperaceae bacterium]